MRLLHLSHLLVHLKLLYWFVTYSILIFQYIAIQYTSSNQTNFSDLDCGSLQAFFLKNVLFNRESSNWRQMTGRTQTKQTTLIPPLKKISHWFIMLLFFYDCVFLEEEQKTELCSTLSEILESACASATMGFCLVTWAKGQSPHASAHTKSQTQSQTQDMPAPESSQSPQEQPSES